METNKKVFIYFDLYVDEEDIDYSEDVSETGQLKTEVQAMQQIWLMLKKFSVNTVLLNEGHDGNGELYCYFAIEFKMLSALQKFIENNRGGGDDIIYLDNGFKAQNFELVEYPGTSEAIPFGNWDELID